jgi:plastocyanin
MGSSRRRRSVGAATADYAPSGGDRGARARDRAPAGQPTNAHARVLHLIQHLPINGITAMRGLAAVTTLVLFATTLIAAGPQSDVRAVVRVGERPAAHAVVWLTGGDRSHIPTPRHPVLDQRNLAFDPRVLVVQVGTTVDMPNNDRVLHNVFSFRDGKRFDLGLYPVGTMRRVTFDHAGVSRVFCNIHPNMAAYVLAVDTPYYGVADERGAVAIPAVARGTYTYHAWRPGAPEITGSIAVDDPVTLELRWP